MAAMSAPERAQFLSRVLGYERLRVGAGPAPARSARPCARGSTRCGRASAIPPSSRPRRPRPRERVAAAGVGGGGGATPRRRERSGARRGPAALASGCRQLRDAGARARGGAPRGRSRAAAPPRERIERLERAGRRGRGRRRAAGQELSRRLAPLPGLREPRRAALERLAEAHARRKGAERAARATCGIT